MTGHELTPVRPCLLHLYARSGIAAARAYHDQGFDVIGVDTSLRVGDAYPFEYHLADPLGVLRLLLVDTPTGRPVERILACPPAARARLVEAMLEDLPFPFEVLPS